MGDDTKERTRERLVRLMDFLQAVHALKYQPVRDIKEYGDLRIRSADLEGLPGVQLDLGGAEWLAIELLPSLPPPELDEGLIGRVHGSVSTASLPSLTSATLESEDAEEVAATLETWCADVGRPWQEEARRVERSRQAYKDLFALRTRLEREHDTFELVWGFWQLRWNREVRIDHPLLVVPAELTYEDRRAQVVIAPSGPVQLAIDPVADLDGLSDRQALTVMARTSATSVTHEPWSPDSRADVERVLRAIDHDGSMGEASSLDRHASVQEGWQLFVRRRPTDYRGFLEGLREQFKDEEAEIPSPLAAVVVDEPSKLRSDSGEDWRGPSGTTELLLPKPANEEQMRILDRSITSNGVTAQGPPGTGKSHTIANLVSHFVASGKRVLVTAQKEGALGVLADKLPEQIRPLCVAVVGSDAQNRSELEGSVKAIFDQVAQADRRASDREIVRLTAEIDKTIQAINAAEARIRDAVRYEGEAIAGEEALPAQLAAWVRNERERLSFIPDELPHGSSPPVTPTELARWFEILRSIEPNDLDAALAPRPPTEVVMASSELKRLAETCAANASTVAAHEHHFHNMAALDQLEAEALSNAAAAIVTMAEEVRNLESGWVAQLAAELANPSMGEQWRGFLHAVSSEVAGLRTLQAQVQGMDIGLPGDGPLTTVQTTLLASLQPRFAQGKKASRFGQKDAAAVAALLSVDGEQPSTPEHLEIISTESERRKLRSRVVKRWNDQLVRIGGPLLGPTDDPEWRLPTAIEQIERAIALTTSFDGQIAWLRGLGLAAQGRPSSADLVAYSEAVSAGAARRALHDAEIALEQGRAALAPHASSALGDRVLQAYDARDHEQLRSLRSELERLDGLGLPALEAQRIEEALSALTPRWAKSAVQRRADAACGTPELMAEAWRWRSLATALEHEHRSVSVAELQLQIKELQARKLELTADLVGTSAWKSVAENFTDAHRQGLTAWLNATKKYGKGTGKYAARHAATARTALDEAKSAVPVWIMSVPTVLRTFRPGIEPAFDVVIVDEASQCGLLDLPVLALGRKVIIVGDDKQTSPENVGTNREPVHELIEEHLLDFPNRKTVFDLDSSLYDIAQQKFPGVVILKEHFRSLPDIIAWSSNSFYGGEIVCLRDRPPSPGWVPVEAIHVPEGYVNRADSTNRVEAEAIVSRVQEMLTDPAYDGMSIGVVTLRAGGQAKLIDELLLDAIGSHAMTERNIRCGEPATFQGDERDVVFLSLVSTKDPTTGRAPGAMTKTSDERRINVAASRARNQMVLVHAVPVEDLPKNDLRASLIRHCADPGRVAEDQDDLFASCDSQFEKDVLRQILDRGYHRVRTQKKVGQYRIDMVIEGPAGSLAVECDGDRWHGEDRWDHDRSRQRVLERAGWEFFRVRGSAYYVDPDGALQGLWDQLANLGIPTGDWAAEQAAERAAATAARAALAAEARSVLGAAGTAVAVTGPPAGAGPLPGTRGADQGVPGLADIQLQPFVAWTPREDVRPPEDYTAEELGKGLARLVAIEGPVVLRRAFRLIHEAAVGRSFTTEDRELFEAAAHWAVVAGRITIENGSGAYIDRTASVPWQPAVVIRTLGNRTLLEVPPSEVRELARRLSTQGATEDRLAMVIAELHGQELTPVVQAFVTHCLLSLH